MGDNKMDWTNLEASPSSQIFPSILRMRRAKMCAPDTGRRGVPSACHMRCDCTTALLPREDNSKGPFTNNFLHF